MPRHPDLDDPVFRTAGDLAAAIRRGDLASEEVVAAHLARIEEVDARLRAVVQLDADGAMATAREADAARRRGEALGPLHGVPVSVKDWIDVAGLRCTGGDPRFRERRPERDATTVARLRRAGAVVLGKTNPASGNALFGHTDNPYRPGYSPAGSSSGEAALVAAGGSPLGLGSDSGGSIRQPAHACGVAGLKPSAGRVPLTGHFPFISATNDPRTVIGPLARRVSDLALALPILAGPDGLDWSAAPVPLADWREVRPEGLRIAFYTRHEGASPSLHTEGVTRAAAAALAAAGATVEETLPPRIDEALPITRDYWSRPESESLDDWRPDFAATMDGEAVERHLFAWDRFRRAMARFTADYDAILTPAAELAARPHDDEPGGIPYTLPYSLVGWPAVVVRAGTSDDGLPIGVQLVAGPWRDDVALALAGAVEEALGGWQPPPF